MMVVRRTVPGLVELGSTPAFAVGRLAVLVLFLLLILSAMADVRPTRAAEDGRISGQLKNATRDGPVPAGATVVLHSVDQNDRVERLTTVTDAEGRFHFDGLATSSDLRYLPVAEYQGALYFSKPLQLGQPSQLEVELQVYESTSTDRWIAVERSNLLVQGVLPDRLSVMEMGAVANVGDRTFVGQEETESARSTLRFSLPPGAIGLAPQVGFSPNDITPADGGFTLSAPLVPGRQQFAFAYSVPFAGERLEVEKRLEYPTQTFNLYVPDAGLQIESPQLTLQGPTELGGQRFLLYSAGNLPRGTLLSIRIGGLPSAPAITSQQLAAGIVGVGCAMVVASCSVVYRRRQLARGPRFESAAERLDQSERAELERMRVLMSLAGLEERYERGEISRAEFDREREVGKQRLLTLKLMGTNGDDRT